MEMYNNIHDTILTELAPHMRRLMKLKKRVLGLDQMLFCDLKAPMDTDFNQALLMKKHAPRFPVPCRYWVLNTARSFNPRSPSAGWTMPIILVSLRSVLFLRIRSAFLYPDGMGG